MKRRNEGRKKKGRGENRWIIGGCSSWKVGDMTLHNIHGFLSTKRLSMREGLSLSCPVIPIIYPNLLWAEMGKGLWWKVDRGILITEKLIWQYLCQNTFSTRGLHQHQKRDGQFERMFFIISSFYRSLYQLRQQSSVFGFLLWNHFRKGLLRRRSRLLRWKSGSHAQCHVQSLFLLPKSALSRKG